ncbi:lysostaphin resistance A-like protein [Mycoplasma sp. P36-A1]|uniref:CPBP family intramembrane glutamic endopeptidase n=1 Tax=Mycoplasma sp. P36-A1 TaxID=3252900 RepID=UPI003C2BC470
MSRFKSIINITIYNIFPIIVQIIFAFYIKAKFASLSADQMQSKLVDTLGSIQGMAIMMIPTLMIIILLNYKYLRKKIHKSFENIKETFKYGLIGYIIMTFAIVVFSILVQLMQIDVSEAENQQVVNNMMSGASTLTIILVIGLIVPFLEELIFRMSIAGLLIKDKVSKSWLPYIIMALIFALIHENSFITNFSVEAVVNFLTYLIPSLTLSFVYKVSNHNIIATYIMHILNNVIPSIFY